MAEKWELSAKNTGTDSKCWWEQKIDKIMWGTVKKCAEYRLKSRANGSICKLNKSFLLGLLSISWLDLWSSHTTVERGETSLTSSIEFAQQEKSVRCCCFPSSNWSAEGLSWLFSCILAGSGEWVRRREPWAGSLKVFAAKLLPPTQHLFVPEGWVTLWEMASLR